MSTRSEAAGVGTGGLIKSNQTSADNTLAFPIGPGTITYKKPNRAQALTTNNNNNNTTKNHNSTGSTQVAGGGSILKSNNTSAENPLSYASNNNNDFNNNNSYENTMSATYGDTAAAAASSSNNDNNPSRTNVFPAAEAYRRTNQASPNQQQQQQQQQPQQYDMPFPPPQPLSTFNNQQSGFYSAPMPQTYSVPDNLNNNYDMYHPKTAMTNMPSPRDNNNNNNNGGNDAKPRDIRFDVDHTNKQAYKRALDQQVAEKEIMKYNEQKAKLRSERDVLKQYPFGRRTDLSSMVGPDDLSGGAYEPSFYNNNNMRGGGMPGGGGGGSPLDQPMRFLNKDNIVEKPNSLSADIPPYDPIKHRNGFHQGFNYDPWGKPGSGAPLIDPSTGRKFTKYSGQVWYDTIGLSPDDRAKAYSDRNRPVTLEEQRRDMEVEKQRRQYEEAVYKSRAGDVATWITEIENQRNKHRMYGAHLPHTNVTRDKINLEYARRFANMQAKNYHDELGVQLEERQRSKMLHKLKEDVAGIEHTRKWDDWWGKPGGGAPNMTLRRHDINGSLESPRGNPDGSTTSLPIGAQYDGIQPDGSLMFTKGTLRSSHRNLYDNLQEMKL